MKEVKILKRLFASILVLLPTLTNAGPVKVDGIYYYINTSEKTASVAPAKDVSSSHYIYRGDVIIPEQITYNYNNYSVVSIEESAFEAQYGLNSVAIGNNVTSIGKSAFESTTITKVNIPDGVKKIEDNTFWSCTKLSSVEIGKSVESIGTFAFASCKSLTSVVIPNSVKSIGNGAFSDCPIHSLTIGKSVTSIGSFAFDVNSKKKTIWLTKTRPSGWGEAKGTINYVLNEDFANDNSFFVYPYLYSIFEVDGIKYVPTSTKDLTCDAIDIVYDKSTIELKFAPHVEYESKILTVEKIRDGICLGNTHLEKIVAEVFNEIGSYAFYGCKNLNTLIWGNICNDIDIQTFNGIYIGNNVNEVRNNVFNYCENLNSLIISDREKELYIGSQTDYSGSPLYPLFRDVPLDSVYIGGNIIYDKTSYYLFSPFNSNKNIRTVVIADKETEISEKEFFYCSNLQSVIIGNNVTTLGDWAFAACTKLKFLTIGKQVQYIGQEAFADCTAVEEITSKAITPPICGTKALSDINKWSCKLYVPTGTVEAYKAAEQWQDFFIEEQKYNLIYRIDGQIYKNYSYNYGAPITPEVEPTKEGYTFSGWSDIPETMPAHDVTVTGTFSVNKYKLKYMVDGVEYKSYEVEYGAIIIPETAPTKEGYTFSGWSEIPTTMPAHDVTVTGTFTIDTAIDQIMSNGERCTIIFTIDGKRVDKPQHGLNIVRMSDGTTKKVVVK